MLDCRYIRFPHIKIEVDALVYAALLNSCLDVGMPGTAFITMTFDLGNEAAGERTLA